MNTLFSKLVYIRKYAWLVVVSVALMGCPKQEEPEVAYGDDYIGSTTPDPDEEAYTGPNPYWKYGDAVPYRRRALIAQDGTVLGAIEVEWPDSYQILNLNGYRMAYTNTNAPYILGDLGTEDMDYVGVSPNTGVIAPPNPFGWDDPYLYYMEDGNAHGYLIKNFEGDATGDATEVTFVSYGAGWQSQVDVYTGYYPTLVTKAVVSVPEEVGGPLTIGLPPEYPRDTPGGGHGGQNEYWPLSSSVPTRRRRVEDASGAVLGAITGWALQDKYAMLLSQHGYQFLMDTNLGTLFVNVLQSTGGEAFWDPTTNETIYIASGFNTNGFNEMNLMYIENSWKQGYLVTNSTGDGALDYYATLTSSESGAADTNWATNATAVFGTAWVPAPEPTSDSTGYLLDQSSRTEAGLPEDIVTPLVIKMPPKYVRTTPGAGIPYAENPYWPASEPVPTRRRRLIFDDTVIGSITLTYQDMMTVMTKYGYQITFDTNDFKAGQEKFAPYSRLDGVSNEAIFDPIENENIYMAQMPEWDTYYQEPYQVPNTRLIYMEESSPNTGSSASQTGRSFVSTNTNSDPLKVYTPDVQTDGSGWVSGTGYNTAGFLPLMTSRTEAGLTEELTGPVTIELPPPYSHVTPGGGFQGAGAGANPYWPMNEPEPTRRRYLVDTKNSTVEVIVGTIEEVDDTAGLVTVLSRYNFLARVQTNSSDPKFIGTMFSKGGEGVYDPVANDVVFFDSTVVNDYNGRSRFIYMEALQDGTHSYVSTNQTPGQDVHTFTMVQQSDGQAWSDITPVQKTGLYMPALTSRIEFGLPDNSALIGPFVIKTPTGETPDTPGHGLAKATNVYWPQGEPVPTRRRALYVANQPGSPIGSIVEIDDANDMLEVWTYYGFKMWIKTNASTPGEIQSELYSIGGEAMYDPVQNTATYLDTNTAVTAFEGDPFLVYMPGPDDLYYVSTNESTATPKSYTPMYKSTNTQPWSSYTTAGAGYLLAYSGPAEAGIPETLEPPYTITFPPSVTYDDPGHGLARATNTYWPKSEPIPTRRRYLQDGATILGTITKDNTPYFTIATVYGFQLMINQTTGVISNVLFGENTEAIYDPLVNEAAFMDKSLVATDFPSGYDLLFMEDGISGADTDNRGYVLTDPNQTVQGYSAEFKSTGSGWTTGTWSDSDGLLPEYSGRAEAGLPATIGKNLTIGYPAEYVPSDPGHGLAYATNKYWPMSESKPTRRRRLVDKNNKIVGSIQDMNGNVVSTMSHAGFQVNIDTSTGKFVSSIYATGGEDFYDPIVNTAMYVDAATATAYPEGPVLVYMEDGETTPYPRSVLIVGKTPQANNVGSLVKQSTGSGWSDITSTSKSVYSVEYSSRSEGMIEPDLQGPYTISNPDYYAPSNPGHGLANAVNPYWPITEPKPTERRWIEDKDGEVIGTIVEQNGSTYIIQTKYGFYNKITDLNSALLFGKLYATDGEDFYDPITNTGIYVNPNDLTEFPDIERVYMEDGPYVADPYPDPFARSYIVVNKSGDPGASYTAFKESSGNGWGASTATGTGYIPEITSRAEAGIPADIDTPLVVKAPPFQLPTDPGHGLADATNMYWNPSTEYPRGRRYLKVGSDIIGTIIDTNASGVMNLLSKYGFGYRMATNKGALVVQSHLYSTAGEEVYNPITNEAVYIQDSEYANFTNMYLVYMEDGPQGSGLSGRGYVTVNRTGDATKAFTGSLESVNGNGWSTLATAVSGDGYMPEYSSRTEAGIPLTFSDDEVTVHNPIWDTPTTPGHGISSSSPYWPSSSSVPTKRRHLSNVAGGVLGSIVQADPAIAHIELETKYGFSTFMDTNNGQMLGQVGMIDGESYWNMMWNEGFFVVSNANSPFTDPYLFTVPLDDSRLLLVTNSAAPDVKYQNLAVTRTWDAETGTWDQTDTTINGYLAAYTSTIEAGLPQDLTGTKYIGMPPVVDRSTPGHGIADAVNPYWPSTEQYPTRRRRLVDANGNVLGSISRVTGSVFALITRYGYRVVFDTNTSQVQGEVHSIGGESTNNWVDHESFYIPKSAVDENIDTYHAEGIYLTYMEDAIGGVNSMRRGFLITEKDRQKTVSYSYVMRSQDSGAWSTPAAAQNGTGYAHVFTSRVEAGLPDTITPPYTVVEPSVPPGTPGGGYGEDNEYWPSSSIQPTRRRYYQDSTAQVIGSVNYTVTNAPEVQHIMETRYGFRYSLISNGGTPTVSEISSKPLVYVRTNTYEELYDPIQNDVMYVATNLQNFWPANDPYLVYLEAPDHFLVVTNKDYTKPKSDQVDQQGSELSGTWTSITAADRTDLFLPDISSREEAGLPLSFDVNNMQLKTPPYYSYDKVDGTRYGFDNPFWPDTKSAPDSRRVLYDSSTPNYPYGAIIATDDAAKTITFVTTNGYILTLDTNALEYKLPTGNGIWVLQGSGEAYYDPLTNDVYMGNTQGLPDALRDGVGPEGVYFEAGMQDWSRNPSGTVWRMGFVITNDVTASRTASLQYDVANEEFDVLGTPVTADSYMFGYTSYAETGLPNVMVPPFTVDEPFVPPDTAWASDNPYWPSDRDTANSIQPLRRRAVRLTTNSSYYVGTLMDVDDTDTDIITVMTKVGFQVRMRLSTGALLPPKTMNIYARWASIEGTWDPTNVLIKRSEASEAYPTRSPEYLYFEDENNIGWLVTNTPGSAGASSPMSATWKLDNLTGQWSSVSVSVSDAYIAQRVERPTSTLPYVAGTPLGALTIVDPPAGVFSETSASDIGNPFGTTESAWQKRRRVLQVTGGGASGTVSVGPIISEDADGYTIITSKGYATKITKSGSPVGLGRVVSAQLSSSIRDNVISAMADRESLWDTNGVFMDNAYLDTPYGADRENYTEDAEGYGWISTGASSFTPSSTYRAMVSSITNTGLSYAEYARPYTTAGSSVTRLRRVQRSAVGLPGTTGVPYTGFNVLQSTGDDTSWKTQSHPIWKGTVPERFQPYIETTSTLGAWGAIIGTIEWASATPSYSYSTNKRQFAVRLKSGWRTMVQTGAQSTGDGKYLDGHGYIFWEHYGGEEVSNDTVAYVRMDQWNSYARLMVYFQDKYGHYWAPVNDNNGQYETQSLTSMSYAAYSLDQGNLVNKLGNSGTTVVKMKRMSSAPPSRPNINNLVAAQRDVKAYGASINTTNGQPLPWGYVYNYGYDNSYSVYTGTRGYTRVSGSVTYPQYLPYNGNDQYFNMGTSFYYAWNPVVSGNVNQPLGVWGDTEVEYDDYGSDNRVVIYTRTGIAQFLTRIGDGGSGSRPDSRLNTPGTEINLLNVSGTSRNDVNDWGKRYGGDWGDDWEGGFARYMFVSSMSADDYYQSSQPGNEAGGFPRLAIADFNSIAWDQGYSILYNSRGGVWNDRNEYQGGIAFYGTIIEVGNQDPRAGSSGQAAYNADGAVYGFYPYLRFADKVAGMSINDNGDGTTSPETSLNNTVQTKQPW